MGKTFKKIPSSALAAAMPFGSAGAGVVEIDSEKLFAPKASAATRGVLSRKLKTAKRR